MHSSAKPPLKLAPMRVNAVSPGGIGIRADRQLVERAG
jgi:hypothetical protein